MPDKTWPPDHWEDPVETELLLQFGDMGFVLDVFDAQLRFDVGIDEVVQAERFRNMPGKEYRV